MLGQPVSMLIPKVVGFKLTGEIPPGATATDVVLTITEMLRRHGVVGKFVEFYGEGVGAVPLANRATIGNMSPEFGSTAAIFPIDDETVRYLKLTGRPAAQLELVEAYAKEQGLWHDPAREPVFSETLELDLSTVVPSIAGPKRPQDRIELSSAKQAFRTVLVDYAGTPGPGRPGRRRLDEAPVGRRVGRGDLPGQRPGRTRWPVRGRGPAPVGLLGRRGRERPGEPAGDRHPRRRRDVRAGPRRRRDLLDHLVHQHVEPVGHARRRPAGQERRRPGPHDQAVGEDVDGARLQGRHRLLRAGRPLAVPGEAGLPPGRLRLHHLHRQLRAAGRGDLGRGQRGRPRRGLRAVGQPELRGPDQPGHQDELPGQPAAGDRLRTRRHDGLRLRDPAAGHQPGWQRGVPARHLADGPRRPGHDRQLDHRGDVHQRLRGRLRRRRALALAAHPRGQAPSRGTRSRPTSASPRTSRACSPTRRRWSTSPAPGCSPSSATR